MADYVEMAKRALERYRAQQEGSGVSTTPFPHCPRCASYALYRPGGQGAFECLTCGLVEIAEAVARRVQ